MKILQNMAIAVLAAVALAIAPASVNPALAGDTKPETSTEMKQEVAKATQDQTAEKRKRVLQEATDAIGETRTALSALDQDDEDAALAALERAAGKLEIILAREPELALAPSSVSAVTVDVLASTEAIESVRDAAENALEDGRLQDARRLIADLASETVISVTNIPLATYPDAIRNAVALIDQGEIEQAQGVLQTALNTLVVTDTVIPLPVVAAEGFLTRAEELTEKADRSEAENARLVALLEDAREQLEFAEALGYGTEQDFDRLYAQLDQISDRTAQGDSGEGFFSKIRSYLSDAVHSSQPDSGGESA